MIFLTFFSLKSVYVNIDLRKIKELNRIFTTMLSLKITKMLNFKEKAVFDVKKIFDH